MAALQLCGRPTPAWAAPITDLPQEAIERLAEEIASVDGCMIYGSRGINQHTNGTQTNRALMFLAAMTGNWARPGGGIDIMILLEVTLGFRCFPPERSED